VTFNLLVGGKRPPGSVLSNGDMDHIEAIAIQSHAYQARRCESPRDLISIVEGVYRLHGPIDILDLVDHGGPGRIHMGDALLFASDGDPSSELLGRDIAARLAPFLTETAHVRLLGCKTSVCAPGSPHVKRTRLLLLKLARALGGHRVAFGTLSSVRQLHFSPYGFGRDREELMLFSSLAAMDAAAPSASDRGAQAQQMRPLQYNPLADGGTEPYEEPTEEEPLREDDLAADDEGETVT
jgi:hypothetical protein